MTSPPVGGSAPSPNTTIGDDPALREYQRTKFALADVLRAAAHSVPVDRVEWHERARELFARLAEDRFYLAIIGRFNRGKTSLLNAVLGANWLPVGIVPLTSVITTVSYGSSARAMLRYRGRTLPREVAFADLPRYLTAAGNPANVMGIERADLQVPVELLRRDFHLVDTPGLGSAIAENTRTTEDFLPAADAYLLVTSFDSPLSVDELQFISAAAPRARQTFVAVNKRDAADAGQQAEILGFIGACLAERWETPPPLYPVSAQQALAARASDDSALLAASGIPAIEAAVTRFVLADKRAVFIRAMGERVQDLVRELPVPRGERPFTERVAAVISMDEAPGRPQVAGALRAQEEERPARFAPCEICTSTTRALWDYLCHFQYLLSRDPEARQTFAVDGGFCGVHTWQFASLASPHTVATGYPELLEQLARRLHKAATHAAAGPATPARGSRYVAAPCRACQLRDRSEADAVADLAARLEASDAAELPAMPTLCVAHTMQVVARLQAPGLRGALLQREAATVERVAEHLRRLALTHDAVRRLLANEEDNGAPGHAMQLVGSHRLIATSGADGCGEQDR